MSVSSWEVPDWFREITFSYAAEETRHLTVYVAPLGLKAGERSRLYTTRRTIVVEMRGYAFPIFLLLLAIPHDGVLGHMKER